MRRVWGAIVVIVLCAAPALAGDQQVSNQSLARMGLAGMRPLSDIEGLTVRGQFAIAGSFSTATGGSTIILANNPIGQHFAISATIAVGHGVAAGGFAVAHAH